jgi:hypothetical protein
MRKEFMMKLSKKLTLISIILGFITIQTNAMASHHKDVSSIKINKQQSPPFNDEGPGSNGGGR